LSKANGVFFQGGGVNIAPETDFSKKALFILNKVIDFNENGTYYPLCGTCLGFELLHVIIANSKKVLTSVEASGIKTPLDFNIDEIKKTKMFSMFDDFELNALRSKNTTAQFHKRNQRC
jgi:gamma-glutamyl hydrolase